MLGIGGIDRRIASRALVYSGFLLGFVGIYSGVFRLACYSLQCPSPSIALHMGILLGAALPLVRVGVGSLLSPAYYAYPPHGFYMISIAVLGAFYSAASLIDLSIDGGLGGGARYILLSTISLLFSASNLDLFAKGGTKGFLRLMNISFHTILLVDPNILAIYSDGACYPCPSMAPSHSFCHTNDFSVMMRTDPYTRKWYKEDLSQAVFPTSIIAIASGFISIVGLSVGSDALLELALALLAGSMIIAGTLLIPRKSGVNS